jgi:large subunit ribosomal protein L17
MRHKKQRASLGVTKEHRAAMLSNMAASLIEHGRITTTLTKAKALRPFIEKVITKAKKAALAAEKKDAIHHRRMAMKDVRDENAITSVATPASTSSGPARAMPLTWQSSSS